MSIETHINALIDDVEAKYKEAHGAIDELKTAVDKIKAWYNENGSEVKTDAEDVEKVAELEAGSTAATGDDKTDTKK